VTAQAARPRSYKTGSSYCGNFAAINFDANQDTGHPCHVFAYEPRRTLVDFHNLRVLVSAHLSEVTG